MVVPGAARRRPGSQYHADPRFVCVNRMVQGCFEHGWEEFLTLPPRLSVDFRAQAERQRLLGALTTDGRAGGSTGPRVTRSGRRCSIQGGVVWQLVHARGEVRRQAAKFPHRRNAWFRSPAT